MYIEAILNYEKKSKVIMSNTNNLIKTNKHLSPQLIQHKQKPWHMTLETHVLAWDRHKHVAGLKRDRHNKFGYACIFRMASGIWLIHCCLYLAIRLTSSSEELSMILQISSTILSFNYVYKSYISIKKNDF